MGRPMLTLSGAAERAGTSKSTVHRWIRSGRLSATRADDGSTYLIDPSELERVLSASRPIERPTERLAGRDETLASVPVDAELRLRNAMLEPEIAGLRELLATERRRVDDERRRADEWKETADRWAAQAERLALTPPARPSTVPAVPVAPAAPSHSWWPWRR